MQIGAVITTSDQSVGNQQDCPWNAVDGSSNPRDKECLTQWQLLLGFIQETDANYQKLQQAPGQNVSPNLRAWLTKYCQSREVRQTGLRTLADILRKSVPINFDEILCAVVVLHAVHDPKRNSFEGDVESALRGWSYMNSLTDTNRETLGIVLKRLASSPTFLGDLSKSKLSGTGSRFVDDTLRPLSIVVSDNPLPDMPTYGPPDYNTGASPLNSQINDIFISGSGYQISHSLNSHPTPDSYASWGPENAALNPSAIMALGYPFQNNLGAYPQPHGPGQLYGSTQSPGYLQHETPTDMVNLDQSTPLVCFMGFVDDFMNLGDLHYLFSNGKDTPHPINLPATYNARVSENERLMNAERSLFSPLRDSPSLHNPLMQAIISTTRSLAVLGGLSSLAEMIGYMINLGMNILESSESCHSFTQAVMQHCPKGSIADVIRQFDPLTQNLALDKFIEEIASKHSGAYHPAHLIQSPDTRVRSQRTLHSRESITLSRTSSSRLTPSNFNMSASNMRSRMDNTEMSVVSEMTTNTTTSTTSTVKCKECGKLYKGRNHSSHLSRHKRSHRDADEIRCPSGCSKVFRGSRTDNIRAHCRKVHNEELPLDYWARGL
ncbi:hypothetical protein F4776DRAFT_188602 [Hypoxylon sp. NC0597]|nr:hypothetical protein F4776DRAFT_188602 [Hypoxylon sp. NC0597]